MANSDSDRSVSNDESPADGRLPTQKEPWQRPTLESLDVADTEAMQGFGLDGSGNGSTLS